MGTEKPFKEFTHDMSNTLLDYKGEAKNPYTGWVKLKVLPYIERNKLVQSLDLSDKTKEGNTNEFIEKANAISEIVKEQIISMEVRKGETVFTSVDEIDYDMDVGVFYTELGQVITRGVQLGKYSKRDSKKSAS